MEYQSLGINVSFFPIILACFLVGRHSQRPPRRERLGQARPSDRPAH